MSASRIQKRTSKTKGERFHLDCQCCIDKRFLGAFNSREEALESKAKHDALHFPTLTEIFGQRPTTWKTAEPTKTRDHSLVQTRGHRRMKAGR